MRRRVVRSRAILRPAAAMLALGLAGPALSQGMQVFPDGSRPTARGPKATFTGTVRVDPRFASPESRLSAGHVAFDPGARSAWHSHPAGQVLIVTSGTGWVQEWNGQKRVIRPGDVVWTPPGVKHWHGATATSGVSHLAIQESVDGRNVEWLEKVADEQYASPVAPADAAAPSSRAVAPAFARYTEDTLLGEVWKRPGLSPRDRSVVTLAALIARGQTVELPFHIERALDGGVTPAEIAEIVTHLAFYAGWGSANAAVPILREAFTRRGIGADRLPEAVPAQPLPLDQAAESRRAARVESDFGAVSPNLVKDTTDILFRDLWLRPGLAPRDRSLVTVSALVANGQVAQMPYHLNRAMDAGLTKEQAGEVIAHLAYYAGWPNAFSALPVARSVFEARAK